MYARAILKLLETHHLLSIADISKRIPDADYSTIYRNIKNLMKTGKVRSVVLDKNKVMYETNSTNNSHWHFYCDYCGAVERIDITSESMFPLVPYVVKDVLLRGVCNKHS